MSPKETGSTHLLVRSASSLPVSEALTAVPRGAAVKRVRDE